MESKSNTPVNTTIASPTASGAASADAAGEVRKLSFWVSQIFILIATVLGVFLAANQGFKQALVFENIQSNKSNYYLRMSLQQELSDNVTLIKEYIADVNAGNSKQAPLNLYTFVWDSMRYSSATLETPSGLLRDSQHFYRQVNDTHEKIANNVYAVSYGTKKLQEVVEHMEKTVLPQFSADTDRIRSDLKTLGVDI